jgi:hypothetical protein
VTGPFACGVLSGGAGFSDHGLILFWRTAVISSSVREPAGRHSVLWVELVFDGFH